MTTLTHIAIGAVIAKAALTGYATGADPALVYAVAILFSNIPDSDIPLYGIKKSMQFTWNHRLQSFLHYPIFWLGLFLLFRLLMPEHVQQPLAPYIPVALVALLLHFLMDTVGIHYGICWFGPFFKKDLSFTRLSKNKPSDKRTYITAYTGSVVFKIEVLLWIGSLWYLFMRPV